MTTAWLQSRVNYRQVPWERQAKYRVALILGAQTWLARRMRDWTWSHIERWGLSN